MGIGCVLRVLRVLRVSRAAATLAGLCACASTTVQWPSPEAAAEAPAPTGDQRRRAAGRRALRGDRRGHAHRRPGGPPVRDAVVVVRGDRIVAARRARRRHRRPGRRGGRPRRRALWVLPGLIDAHFHLDGDDGLPGVVLERGVTCCASRGTGSRRTTPRASSPPDAAALPGGAAARRAVSGLSGERDAGARRGRGALGRRSAGRARASAIRVYFRLPSGSSRRSLGRARARGDRRRAPRDRGRRGRGPRRARRHRAHHVASARPSCRRARRSATASR